MAKPKDTPGGLHKALAHPLRAKILLALEDQGICSPNGFAAGTKGTDNEVSLNVVAYHFRVLLKYEAIEEAETKQRRGATEHFYRVNPKSQVLDLVRAADLLEQVTGGTSNGAYSYGFVDAERVAILPIEVDRSGQTELQDIIATLKTGLIELSENCGKRLSKSAEPPIALRVGIATYSHNSKSSPPPFTG